MKKYRPEPVEEKKSLLSRILLRVPVYLFLAGITFWGMAYWNASKYPPAPPMEEMTSSYRQMFSFATAWPFYYKYYLYSPKNYDPNRAYPALILLHGQSRHMWGGQAVLRTGAQAKHDAFIIVPIAPAEMVWAAPNGVERSALPLAIDALRDVQSKYNIDEKRVYVSGYSMGGTGTFAIVEQYPDIFAAAMPLCGYWPADRAERFPNNVPLLALHGQNDSPEGSRDIVNALSATRRPAFFREYPNVGHDVWTYAYADIRMWDWLFANKRK